VVGPDGQVRRRSRTFGEVIDSEGWEVDRPTGELPPHEGPGRGDR
jgi:hypothetical protein